ncbi:MAG: DUF3306 domain-containing protein, partial [Gammaproteobacteria bacterium]|nr:DUF3306 domain-containing protein [Gammaproteobacteria bacterium]
MPEEDTFLSRWARRKRIAREGRDPDDERRRDGERAGRTDQDERVPQPQAAADETAPAARASRDEPTDADMPDVDSIDENTDMSGFFSSKVTDAVKRAALKKFFHSSAFNVVDGLDDYAEDFTSFAPLGDIVTADMRHRMEVEAERARAAAEAELAEEALPADAAEAGEREDAGDGQADGARADA